MNHALTALCLVLVFAACTPFGGSPGDNNATDAETPLDADQAGATAPTAPSATDANTESPASSTVFPCTIARSSAVEPRSQVVAAAQGVRYDEDTNTIILRKAPATTLAGVSQALKQNDLLREVASGEWLLSANLRIEAGAALLVAAPEVRWLKLHSDEQKFISIKALGGRLDFVETCVSSWNPRIDDFDQNYDDGRSFVLARDGAHMEIMRSELRNLGYAADESYGLAWRVAGTSGQIVDSRLGYNYYGLYTHSVSDLVIRGNEVHHSVLYGIDPHTDSNRLLIEDNITHHNGKHGIILAEDCSDSVVRNNITHHNRLHGIVLYQGSNDNLVEGNVAYSNGLQGININDADRNTVRNNTVYDNRDAGIGVGQGAKQNVIINNQVYANTEDGIYLYSNAEANEIGSNTINDNRRYGIYVKSPENRVTDGNEIFNNRVGIYLNTDDPPTVSRDTNRIYANREADIQTHE